MKDDYISRQAAINAIGNIPDYDDGMVFEALSHAIRDIALLPSAQPEQRWIPCSEKFPSPCVVVLVQTKYSVIATAYYKDGKWYSYPQWGEYTSDGWKQKDLVIGSVIAWRPLPEKYEEVKDERSES